MIHPIIKTQDTNAPMIIPTVTLRNEALFDVVTSPLFALLLTGENVGEDDVGTSVVVIDGDEGLSDGMLDG